MKKMICLLVCMILLVPVVYAVEYNDSDIPDSSIIIGHHLFTTEPNPSTGWEGRITTKFAMLAATSFDSVESDSPVANVTMYYKWGEDDYADYITDDTVTINFPINIYYVNGSCIDDEYCGNISSSTKNVVLKNDYESVNEIFKTIPVTYNEKVPSKELNSVPNRAGYKFVCWSSNLQNKACYDFDQKIVEDIELFAWYEPINYKLTYYNNSGETIKNIVCNIGNIETVNECKFDLGTSQPVAPTGYDFVGWSTSPKGSDYVYNIGDSLESLMVGAEDVNIKLYPVFKAKTYAITYNLNGGTYENLDTSFTFDDAVQNVVSIPFEPSKLGYELSDNSAINVSNGSYNNKKIVIDINSFTGGDVVVNVSWSPITYTVKSGSRTVGNCTYDSPCTLAEPLEGETPAGERFIGYSLSNNDKTNLFVGSVKNLRTTSGTVNVFPQFEEINYTIDYNLDGGILPSSVNLKHSYNKSENLVSLPSLSKVGYEFKGWIVNYNSNNVITDEFDIDVSKGDVTFTAKFDKINYKIYYDGVESDATCNVDGCIINKAYTTTGNSEFVGWGNEVRNPTYVFKNDKNVSIKLIDELSTVEGDDYKVNLYNYVVDKGTKWAFITYDLDGGTFTDPSSINARVDITNGPATVNLAPVNNKIGYMFKGWSIRNEAGNVITTVTESPYSYTISQNVTAVAIWQPVNTTITINAGSNNSCTFTYQYGSSPIVLEERVESESDCSSINLENLKGWALSSGGSLYYGTGVALSDFTVNNTFYALYEEELPDPISNRYTVSFYNGDEKIAETVVDAGTSINQSEVGITWPHEWENYYSNASWVYENGSEFTFDDIIESDINVYCEGSLPDPVTNKYTVTFYKGFRSSDKIGEALVDADCSLADDDCVNWTDELDEGYNSSSIWHTSPDNNLDNVFDWNSTITQDMNLYTQRLT